jgi:hypothetical protein
MKNKKGKGMAIIISMGDGKKSKGGKCAMAYGGMAGGKKHMYSAGGSVTDNSGLRALKASGPKGMAAYQNIMKNA